MAKRELPSPELLRQLLDYNSETGVLSWLPRDISYFKDGKQSAFQSHAIWNAQRAGKAAFIYIDPKGYRSGAIFGYNLKGHRVVWAMCYGEWPDGQIDHINGVRSDNRITNLRVVTSGENSKNKSISTRNTSGVCGVYWGQDNKWMAHIGVGGKTVHLGSFAIIDDAISARKSAEAKYGYHQNHGRRALVSANG